MKKLSLLLILAALILGVYGCGEEPSKPVLYQSADKIEPAFPGYDFIADIFQNNYDDNYYAILRNHGTKQYDIFKSTDLGATWQLEDIFTMDMFDSTMNQFYNAPNIIYGNDDYVYYYINSNKYRKSKSESKFQTLKTIIVSEDSTYFCQFGSQFNFADKDGVLYASAYAKSTDYGETWVTIKRPFEYSSYSAAIDNYIISNAEISTSEYQYYVSADKGETWTKSTFDYSRNEKNSKYYKFYSNEYIAYNKQPSQIKKPEKGDFYIYDINSNNTVIASRSGYFDHEEDYYGFFSIYTSKDDGENWKFHFSFDSRDGSYYTKSGFIYFNSERYNFKGIKRNKTALK